jgi:hydrogenase maturation factor
MAAAAERADVTIVGGDTKVVERGKADGMYIIDRIVLPLYASQHGTPQRP